MFDLFEFFFTNLYINCKLQYVNCELVNDIEILPIKECK